MSSSRILPEFELLMPQSIYEAVEMLAKLKTKASVMSGGTDVVVSMTKGFGAPMSSALLKFRTLTMLRTTRKRASASAPWRRCSRLQTMPM